MKIISRIIDFFFGSSDNDFQPTEQEIEEAERVANGYVEDQQEAEEVAEKQVETDEEENSETCVICGKTFYGEHTAQKKGGHKASAH